MTTYQRLTAASRHTDLPMWKRPHPAQIDAGMPVDATAPRGSRKTADMLVDSVRISNFRSIADSGRMRLGPVTLIIGANNSGKSALLRALMMAHTASQWKAANVRYGTQMASVRMKLTHEFPRESLHGTSVDLRQLGELQLSFDGDDEGLRSTVSWPTEPPGNPDAETGVIVAHTRPRHAIVPVLTRRRSPIFDTSVGTVAASIVGLDDRSLVSRLGTLAGNHAEGKRYREAMERVLGFDISTFPLSEGMVPGVALDTSSGIPLDHMGDGVRNVTTLIAELVDMAQPRLFLIEEPENDLHPSALVAVLDEIRNLASYHQFVVTTHSDVVVRELGSLPDSKLYRTEVSHAGTSDPTGAPEGLPSTTFVELDDELSRRMALTSLGYVHELPSAWLILEESTVEKFINGCLVPLFAPRLAAVQTVAARGVNDVKRTLTAFHRMVLFTHLGDQTLPRAWVLVDGDPAGQKAVKDLQASFEVWPPGRFVALDEANIEAYYPSRFQDAVAALSKAKGLDKQQLKGKLVEEVVAWAAEETDEIRSELANSARSLIDHLQRIERDVRQLQLGRYRTSGAPDEDSTGSQVGAARMDGAQT